MAGPVCSFFYGEIRVGISLTPAVGIMSSPIKLVQFFNIILAKIDPI